jgi:amino acid permease
MFTVNLFFSYPLQIAPAVNLVESWIFKVDSSPTNGRVWAQNAVRAGMVLFTLGLAYAIYPVLAVFLDIIGAATCAPLSFTLPALFHYKLVRKSKLTLAIVIGASCMTVVCLVLAFIDLIKAF